MKKMTAILMLTTMLLCTACGNSDTRTSGSSVSSTSGNSSVFQAENNSSEDDNFLATDIKDGEPENEGYYFDWNGVNYFVPPYFEDTYRSGKSIWGKNLESGNKEYLSLIMAESYGSRNGIDTYNLDDVPEILREKILSDMNEFFDVGATASEITCECAKWTKSKATLCRYYENRRYLATVYKVSPIIFSICIQVSESDSMIF